MAPVDKTVLVAAAAKLLTGTLIYIAIIAFARSYPGAAGMMLTFPALNGFTMALTDRQDLRNVAGVMLLMPIINCSLCAGFIYAFLWLATFTAPSLDGLLAGVSIIWAGVAAYVGTRGIDISCASPATLCRPLGVVIAGDHRGAPAVATEFTASVLCHGRLAGSSTKISGG